MKAVILAGGRGTRLSPLTCEIPKPLVRILDQPVMAHILALLNHHGIRDAVVTVSYLADRIREYFGDEFCGVRLHYCYEESPLGTAGGVKAAEDLLTEDDDESFLVISGDAMCDFDLKRATDFHREQNADATLLLKESETPLQYGVVKCRDDGRIFGFVEKPEWSQVCSDRVNTGVYLLKKSLLKKIAPQTKFDFSADLFPQMLRENARLFGCLCEGYWRDIGSPSSYFSCNRDAVYNRIKLHLPPDGTVQNTRLGKWYCSFGASVDEDAVIGDGAVIGRGCRVEAGASVSSCVLCDECTVERCAVVKDSILDKRVTVGKNAVVAGQSVVGAHSRIEAGGVCIGRILPSRSRILGSSFFSEGVGESVVCEEECFVFAKNADESVFFRFGAALAKVCSAPLLLSQTGISSSAASLARGLLGKQVTVFLSDAADSYQSAYSAAAASSFALHLYREKERVFASLFAPDGFPATRSFRKRLISAFHSVSDLPDAAVREGSPRSISVKETYLAALCAALPQRIPSVNIGEGGGERLLCALGMRQEQENHGEQPKLFLDFTDETGLRVSFSSHKSFDFHCLRALFAQTAPHRSVGLFPPVPEGLLRTNPNLFLLEEDRRQRGALTLLTSLEFHDPAFGAAKLLSLCAHRSPREIRELLEQIPSLCVTRRFYPHDRSQGGFARNLCRLFLNSGEEGLVIRRPQGTVRIYPSAFHGYRVYAEALKSEAAEELCAYAAEKIPTVQS